MMWKLEKPSVPGEENSPRRGEGHLLWVLTVGYPGGKTRQLSLHPNQIPQVRKALDHYGQCKRNLEAIANSTSSCRA